MDCQLCSKESGVLCEWASYDTDICCRTNKSKEPIYLCKKCAYWSCNLCDKRMCKPCFLDMQTTDSIHCYYKNLCWNCKNNKK